MCGLLLLLPSWATKESLWPCQAQHIKNGTKLMIQPLVLFDDCTPVIRG